MAEQSVIDSVNTGNPELDSKVKDWLKWDKNEQTSSEIQNLLKMKDYEALSKCLLKRMEFGTAGLRSALGAGFSKMNDLTVIQASQGLCKYLIGQFEDIKERGVVIGHDARYGSHRFARLSAAIFLHCGIKVYLYSDIVCTPFVPFGVVKYNCVAGIMVTASHNPKEDNGYKVYYSNGAQIIPPHDKGISDSIMANLEPLATSWDEDIHKTSPLCIDPLDEVMNDYMKTIQTHCHHRDVNKTSTYNITYTAMHGVGERFEIEAFKAFSLKPFFTTPEQAKPDPDFPTVKYPNPEEGKGALTLAMKTAEANNSSFIIANDPDADRLAIAEKNKDGAWKIFTGNEIGLLLGWWSFNKHKEQNPSLYPGDSVNMIHSTVSSMILQSIGKVEGFKVHETLTGFKWMGNVADELQKGKKHVLFAFEEAIGFMFGTQVLDKDGISAGAIISEMATYLNSKGKTVAEHLEELYQRYGMHISNNSYLICHSQPTIKSIFHRMRTMENGSYPSKVGPFKVLGVRDLTGEGYDSSTPDKKPTLPTSSSNMITFKFDEGCVATIRTSGTEPKIKYYSEISRQPGDSMSWEDAGKKIDELIEHLVQELLEPEKNQLQRRPVS
ncbi:phosphopentomutase-like [Clytia hemisphaerica]|uniref:Phosphoglucomutase n=1 Tax=Clytia hemisphaerica TaxID=252671 RepID=A0A7M5UGS1_9CNID